MKITKITVSSDFTDSPGARYRNDGPYSGQEFYEDILKPKLDRAWHNEEILLIDFDNTLGYASSFISEVFLRISKDFKNAEKIKSKIKIKSEDDPFLEPAINQIIDEMNNSKKSE